MMRLFARALVVGGTVGMGLTSVVVARILAARAAMRA